jgi:trans-aconitate methyltransferase
MYQWNAADYAANSRGQEVWAKELIASLDLKPDDVALDVGCGDGRNTGVIAAQLPNGRALGVDLSSSMVEHARLNHRAPNLQFAQADASALKFDNEFTLVFSNATLHWILDHRPVLAGIARALRQRGRFIAQMGGHGNGAEVIAAFDAVGERSHWYHSYNRLTPAYGFHHPDDYGRWLTELGFAVEECRLIPKDMIHADRSAFAGWLRTAWHPYISRIDAAERDAFIEEVVQEYLRMHPADGTQVHVAMMRLQVRASRQ